MLRPVRPLCRTYKLLDVTFGNIFCICFVCLCAFVFVCLFVFTLNFFPLVIFFSFKSLESNPQFYRMQNVKKLKICGKGKVNQLDVMGTKKTNHVADNPLTS